MTNTLTSLYNSSMEPKKHRRTLKNHLKEFFRFLDSTPKPSDEKVRIEFLKHEAQWLIYCTENQLGTRTESLFNLYVSLEWERKYQKTQLIQSN